MAARDTPMFLARRSYRARRVLDAARVLPVFGLILFLVPLLWDAGGPSSGGDADPRLAQRGLYLFAVWAGLVICAAALSRALRPGPETPETPEAPATPATPEGTEGTEEPDPPARPVAAGTRPAHLVTGPDPQPQPGAPAAGRG